MLEDTVGTCEGQDKAERAGGGEQESRKCVPLNLAFLQPLHLRNNSPCLCLTSCLRCTFRLLCAVTMELFPTVLFLQELFIIFKELRKIGIWNLIAIPTNSRAEVQRWQSRRQGSGDKPISILEYIIHFFTFNVQLL